MPAPLDSKALDTPFRSPKTYEQLIYGLMETFPTIEYSTLVLIRITLYTALLEGDLHFANGYVLRVLELVDFREHRISNYSYEFYQNDTKLWWYDPWPHPQDKSLASTHPHHKHIEPDIKHHRVPAPDLSFERPNLPFLVREIESFLSSQRPSKSYP
ncbi:MAG: hypothetical protein HY741_21410 [Chloroflexi bacterium]|nr:hypothetical protein [Chloroflexota bacterium]